MFSLPAEEDAGLWLKTEPEIFVLQIVVLLRSFLSWDLLPILTILNKIVILLRFISDIIAI